MKKRLFMAFLALMTFPILFVCGLTVSAAETKAAPTASVFAQNLEFGAQVNIMYAIEVDGASGITSADVGMLFWREGVTEHTPETASSDLRATEVRTISNNENSHTCYIVRYTELYAKEMNDMIASKPYVVYNGKTYYGEEMEYSVCTYAAHKLGLVEGIAGSTDQKLISTLRDMLRYGASMQIYADYKTDDLASAMLDNRINVTYNLKVIMTEDYTNPNPKSFPLAEGKISLQPLEAKGYTFLYWIDDTTQEQVTEIDTSKPGDITLTAIATADRYSITYNNTKGIRNDNPDSYTILDSVDLQPLEKYDYTFNGWRYNDANGEFVGEGGIPSGTTGNIVLYADWTLKPEFEGFDYVVNDEYTLPNGEKFCMLMGVEDNTVTSLEIPSVFNNIKARVLQNCSQLQELSLPYLGADYTENFNSNLAYLFGSGSNADAESVIPQSLSKVTINGGVIAENAFADLKYVKEIVLSPEVTKIGHNAFLNCTALSELTMPMIYVEKDERNDKSLPYYYGMAGAVDGSTIPYDENNLLTLHINGSVSTGSRMFYKCYGISEVTIDNAEVIPEYMFEECKYLSKVTIGDTVEDIRHYAFSETAIEEIVIPDSVKYIGSSQDPAFTGDEIFLANYAGDIFNCCRNLRKVTIGNGVEVISSGMFYGCPIEEIIIGENVHYIGKNAFYGLENTPTIINKSKYKEWVVSGPINSVFMDALMASENAPEKIYYGFRDFEDDYYCKNHNYAIEDSGGTTYKYFLNSNSSQKGTEEQIKNWKLVFYSPTDPYAEGGASSIDGVDDIEYWYHDDGSDWYRRLYYVTPKTWEKPQS